MILQKQFKLSVPPFLHLPNGDVKRGQTVKWGDHPQIGDVAYLEGLMWAQLTSGLEGALRMPTKGYISRRSGTEGPGAEGTPHSGGTPP